MGDTVFLDDPKLWVRRALTLLGREPILRWRTGGVFLLLTAVVAVMAVIESGAGLGSVLRGLGLGMLCGGWIALLEIDHRMQTIFPKYSDGEAKHEDATDSLRAKYVRGEIDHETFTGRLDAKLAAPDDSSTAIENQPDTPTSQQSGAAGDEMPDPITLLRTRYAQGEIDEQEYKARLATLRETDTETAESDTTIDEPPDDTLDGHTDPNSESRTADLVR